MKKIYIIGPPGSGKSTLSKKLSNKYKINNYELDKVVWDDDHGNIKRAEEEILKMFNDIIKTDSWIIEDVGRSKFSEGREQADIIYYLKISKKMAYFRVLKRWIKQRLGKEQFNHPPTFKQLLYFLSIVRSYYQNEKNKLASLQKYNEKLHYLKKKDIECLLK
ncbi:MAG: AAA family ATPase [Bacilli bacterium]|nr:AAA family ATPase [Bacilli bacterium]